MVPINILKALGFWVVLRFLLLRHFKPFKSGRGYEKYLRVKYEFLIVTNLLTKYPDTLRMKDFYKILGLHPAATHDEVRRAFKILARRYHPDVNPGADSSDKFRKIAEAYGVLSDKAKRAEYDTTYAKAGGSHKREYKTHQTQKNHKKNSQKDFFSSVFDQAKKIVAFQTRKRAVQEPVHPRGSTRKISVVEVSITVFESLSGISKTVEISEPEGRREVVVSIPKGARTGDTVKLSSKSSREEILAIIKVIPHPFVSIERRGVIITLPVTIKEAYCGAALQVPTLDGGVVIKIPPLCASGSELRVKEKGIMKKDGTRGDVFFKISVSTPHIESDGLKLAAEALEAGYQRSPRSEILKLFS